MMKLLSLKLYVTVKLNYKLKTKSIQTVEIKLVNLTNYVHLVVRFVLSLCGFIVYL